MQSLLPTTRGLWPPGLSVSDLDPLPLDGQPGSWLLEDNDKRSHRKSWTGLFPWFHSLIKTKHGTRIRDFIPVRRVELVIACQDFSEQVLIVVFVIILIALVIERGVTGQPEEPERPGIIKKSAIPFVSTILSGSDDQYSASAVN